MSGLRDRLAEKFLVARREGILGRSEWKLAYEDADDILEKVKEEVEGFKERLIEEL